MRYLEENRIWESDYQMNVMKRLSKSWFEMYEEYDISCVPINGFEIASKMDIKVIPYSAYPEATQRLLLKKSVDGFCLQLDTGEWYIYYNDKKGYGRINNTIMHEIGHVVT